MVIDVGSGEIVAAGLSMPHSPRLHDGQFWLLNSGSGELGRIDRAKGVFEPVALCPGYARGLTLVGGHAVVGLSLARENSNFQGLDLDRNLADRNIEPQCGLAVVDTGSGEITSWARIEGVVRELRRRLPSRRAMSIGDRFPDGRGEARHLDRRIDPAI